MGYVKAQFALGAIYLNGHKYVSIDYKSAFYFTDLAAKQNYLSASYNMAGYNYTLRDLGDGFNMFSGAVNVLDYVMEDYMVLANYVQAFEGGVVDATNSPLLAKYAGMKLDYSSLAGSGRIEMVTAG